VAGWKINDSAPVTLAQESDPAATPWPPQWWGPPSLHFNAGGGSNLISHTMAGGLTFSGTELVKVGKKHLMAGGLTYAGTNPLKFGARHLMSGGLTFSGTSGVKFGVKHLMSGGVVFSGAFPFTYNPSGMSFSHAMAGGFTLGGTEGVKFGTKHLMTGGLQFSGASAVKAGKVFVMAGGLAFGGAAALKTGHTHAMQGGFEIGADMGVVFTMAPAGGGSGRWYQNTRFLWDEPPSRNVDSAGEPASIEVHYARRAVIQTRKRSEQIAPPWRVARAVGVGIAGRVSAVKSGALVVSGGISAPGIEAGIAAEEDMEMIMLAIALAEMDD
jgi:hypothetical protein